MRKLKASRAIKAEFGGFGSIRHKMAEQLALSPLRPLNQSNRKEGSQSLDYVSPRFEEVVRQMPLDDVQLDDFIQEKLESFALEMDQR